MMILVPNVPKQNWLPLLLADPSACLRWLVLRRLMAVPAGDDEVLELAEQRAIDPLARDLIMLQLDDGSWPSHTQLGYGSSVQRTGQALLRLGYLGFDSDYPAVDRGARFLFSVQRKDGSWPRLLEHESQDRASKYDHIPLQTALPLRGLASCGYATHPDCERAYEWLLSMRLEDGAWPTGYVDGSRGFVAGYRRLAHSRWGCRSNTTGALLCLALHPQRRHSNEAFRGLDLLLGRETAERELIGFDVARTLGFEPVRGFFTYYGGFDLALILKLCSLIGASLDDTRVARLVSVTGELQGDYGLWQYAQNPAASRWVTFDLLSSLDEIGFSSDWSPMEPRTPFAPYPERQGRF
jgi:hypothetical protein